MKLQTPNSAVPSIRCTHRTSGGRQCRRVASDTQSSLCPQHHAAQEQEHAADHFKHLTTNFQFFQTAQGINFSLMNLYQLLAQNRISPRRASVLAYINSLLLRTLPAIDADRAAGITDPTKPPAKTSSLSVSNKDACHGEVLGLGSDSHSDPVPGSVSTWDPSIPEPDPNPKKKPS